METPAGEPGRCDHSLAYLRFAHETPSHDPGRASLLASRSTIRLGRSLALPESRKVV